MFAKRESDFPKPDLDLNFTLFPLQDSHFSKLKNHCTLGISPYPAMLLQYASSGHWEDATKLCR
jgi:hypothetical protein